MPASSRPRFNPSNWLPTQRMWWAILLAVAGGLLLFAMIWMRGRGEPEFYRSGESSSDPVTAEYTPLPVPVGGASESGEMDAGIVPAQDREPAFIEPEPQPARVAENMPLPDISPLPTDAPLSNSPTMPPVPLAGSTPPPRYPARANRRGESGTVMIEARIGANGVPESVRVARGSGSRDLDRAAVDAVRRWRFQPATQDGRPTTGVVNVPISFNRGG